MKAKLDKQLATQLKTLDKKLILIISALTILALIVLGVVVFNNYSPVLLTNTKSSPDETKLLAIGAENRGDIEAARKLFEQAMVEYVAQGNTWGAADMRAKFDQQKQIGEANKTEAEQEKKAARERAAAAGAPDPETESVQ